MKHLKYVLIFGIIIVLGFVGFNIRTTKVSGKYDNFAKCLSDSGIKMYGAYWCSHCKDQKKLFGGSWQYINYIECSLPNNAGQTQVCDEADINAYPTWEFRDGKIVEGGLSMEQLSQYSNCNIEG